MIKHELNGTATKLAGGAATYAGSYTAVEKSLDVAQASEIAALVAGVMTALYFAAQFAYTIWKWRQEAKGIKQRKEKRRG